MISAGDAQTSASGRLRRGSAVLLSLAKPGAGHFLLGAFQRGIAWAAGLVILQHLAEHAPLSHREAGFGIKCCARQEMMGPGTSCCGR